jgi:hypothetical protein
MNVNQEPKRLSPFEKAIRHWFNCPDPKEKEDLLASLSGVDDTEFHPVGKVSNKKIIYDSQEDKGIDTT